MKEDTKKSAPKSKVKIKDIAPKKDAKGGASSSASGVHQSGVKANKLSSGSTAAF